MAQHPLPTIVPESAWSELTYSPDETVIVFEADFGPRDVWWMWCFVDLGGVGFSRVRYSRPFALAADVTADEPDGTPQHPRLVFKYRTPQIPAHAQVG